MKKIFYILCSIVLISSCKKENNKEFKNINDVFSLLSQGVVADANINISGMDYGGNQEKMVSVNLDADFKNNGIEITVESCAINNIPVILNNGTYFNQYVSSSSDFTNLVNSFGNQTTIAVKGGSQFPSFTHSVRLPDAIQAESYPEIISKSQPFTIRFNANNDVNESCVNIAMIDYDNLSVESGMPIEGFHTYQYDSAVGLNQLTFDIDDLKEFPVGGYVFVRLGRAARETINVDGKTININMLSTQHLMRVKIAE